MLQFGGFPIANATVSEETEVLFSHLDLSIHALPQLTQLSDHGTRADDPQLGCSITCVCFHTMSNFRYLVMPIRPQQKITPEGDSPQPFRPDRHDRVLSNHPTFPPYKKKSVQEPRRLNSRVF